MVASHSPDHTVVDRRALIGWAIALFSTFAFSISTPVMKAVINLGTRTDLILPGRFVIATVLMAFLTRRRLRLRRRNVVIALGTGLISGLAILTYFWSLTSLTSSVAAVIFSLYPMIVLILLAMRGERFTYRQAVRLALGLGGVFLLVGPGGQVDLLGVLLVFFATTASAVVTVIVQWYLHDEDPRAVAFYNVTGITLAVLGLWVAQGIQWQDPGPKGWVAIVLLAVVCTYLGRTTWLMAIKYIGGGQVALLTPLETVMSVFWAVLFLREKLTTLQWVGSGMVVVGTLMAVQRLGRARWKKSAVVPP